MYQYLVLVIMRLFRIFDILGVFRVLMPKGYLRRSCITRLSRRDIWLASSVSSRGTILSTSGRIYSNVFF